jgi:phosphohistidine swiveling domain-containing protein
MRFIFQLGDPPSRCQLGGKAGALAQLHRNGLSIPEWFVVLPHAFEASLALEKRRDLAEENDPAKIETLLAQITPTPALMQELGEALANLCPAGELVAVRSSAMDEDGRDYSYAGQLESYLLVPPKEVSARIVLVWKSAFSNRVRAYRAHHEIAGAPRPPAVLVQRMVYAEAAGVAFAADPITGRQDLAVVTAVQGFGTALVNGERNADTWRLDTSGGILRRQFATKERAQPRGRTDGIGSGDPEYSRRPALDDARVRAVARLVRRTSEILGRPQDVEWAIEKGRLYLLQSRPITSIAKRGKLNIWDNSNIIESYSGVTLPLTFSFARRAYSGVYRQFCQMLAVPKNRIASHEHTFRNMLGLIRGRVYYNLLNWYRVLALLPGFALNRRFMEQMMGVKEELPEEVLAELGNTGVGDRLKDGLDVVFSLAALVANHFLLPWKIRRFQGRLNEVLAPPPRALDVMSADELCAYFLGLEKSLLTRWDAPLLNDFFAMIFYGMSRRLLAKWVKDPQGTLQNDLLCGRGGMISTEPAVRIRQMAQMAAEDAGLVKELCDGSLSAIVTRMEEVPNFKSAYLDYLSKFGDRCLGELKLENLTLNDDPMLLLRSVGQLARSHSADTTAQPPNSEVDACRSAEARVNQALAIHPLQRILFRWVLRHTRARVRDRENLRFERTRLFGRVRRIFLALGRCLHGDGHLNDPRDVFFLEVDEVMGFIAGAASTSNLKELVALRQMEFSEYQETEPPPNRFTTHGLVQSDTLWPGIQSGSTAAEDHQRKGVGCCPGVVRGRVRKVTDPRNAVIRQGEILVAERTDPGWIILFPAAAGLLVERGSLLSHSAIVARELRLPAIVAIDGLMGWLNDGDQIEFDGSRGVVQRIESVSAAAVASPSSILPNPNKILSINAPKADLARLAS